MMAPISSHGVGHPGNVVGQVLAGICVNLYGRQQFETGIKMARRIYKAGLRNKSVFQMEVVV